MIVYLTLALVLVPAGRWQRAAVAAAISLSLLVGISRPMLGVHWPSDVIAGWSFGALWVLGTVPLAERIARSYRPRPRP
jgi:undecaprenyl-diphosphatase